MKRILALALALVMMLSMTACGSKGGNDTDKVYELKVSTTQTEKSMIYAGLQAAADSVAEKTNGKVKITIYPSSQLGAEEDMIDQALQGMGIAVLTDAGRLSSYVNDIGILNMAYIVENYEQGLKLMETETFKGWDKGLIEKGIRTLTYNYYDGARSFMGNAMF
jgi:TRAP-type C4-dicarboxylate transport system substrate-binding protein